MPRPGPRPYECVRRAWHSDRHQPMRGSLIQEIFRLANEVHSHGTRKNKEWQEKLPFVVLKAEEIMYSKANSEAEYMDLKTLWDRTNDAIDTIIRKDGTNESGDLLHPCIEAALNLGCIPLRASRSQRHSNPVCYLSPNLKDAADTSPKSQDHHRSTHQISSTSTLRPLLPIRSSHLRCSTTPFGSKCSAVGPEIQFMASNSSMEQKPSFRNPNKEFPCIIRGLPLQRESCIRPTMGCIYPLHYGKGHCPPNPPLPSHTIPQEQVHNNFFYSKPFIQSYSAGDIIFSPDFPVRKTSKPPPLTECDLMLRLGLPSPPTSEVEGFWGPEIEDMGSSSSCDGSMSCGPLPSGAGTMSLESSLSSARDRVSVENIDELYESYRMNGCYGNRIS